MKEQQNSQKPAIDVEALLVKKQQITNAALTSALNKLEQKKKEEQEEMLIANLARVQKNTENVVESLRRIRFDEKVIKKYLEDVVAAQEQFYIDGDIVKYDNTIRAATHKKVD